MTVYGSEENVAKFMNQMQDAGMKIDNAWYDGELSRMATETYLTYRKENENNFNYAELALYFLHHGYNDLDQVFI